MLENQTEKDSDKQLLVLEREKQSQQVRREERRQPSQFYEKYLKNMNMPDSEVLENFKSDFLQEMAAKLQGSMNVDNEPSLKMALLDHTPNMEYMLIQVKYSHFTFPVSILNIDDFSETSKMGECYRGGFSSVYRVFLLQTQLAIKCNSFIEDSFKEVFLNTLQQYVAFKIIEQFRAGPAMTNVFGFQLLVFADSVQFSMEFCSHELRCRAAAQRELREGLLRMHLLHVVHSDVKPDNVCFSHAFGRYVFIDLGLHRVLAEELGEKTLTEFRGSMLYCSKELADCCLTGPQSVDLYHNDAEALNKTLKSINDWQQNEVQCQKEYYELLESDSFLKIIVKFFTININIRPFQGNNFVWQQICSRLRILQQSSAIELSYFFEMLGHTYLLSQFLQQLSQIIPVIKTGFVMEKILTHDLKFNKDQYMAFRNRAQNILTCKSNEATLGIAGNADVILLLKNESQVRRVSKQTYYFLLIRCLQVNCFGVGLEEARKASEVFLAVEAKRKAVATDGHEDRLKQCFAFVFDWALGQPAVTAQVYAVIEQTVPSVVLLEAAEEPALVDRLLRLLDLPAPPLLRVRLCLLVLSSLEWVHQKYAPKYSYFRMMDAVCSHMQHTVQNIKKQPLSEEEQTFVYFLEITTTRLRGNQKRKAIIQHLIKFAQQNLYNMINSNKQKSLLQKQIILYWTYYLYKQNFKTDIFHFLFDHFVKQIIKRDLQVSLKIGYYYDMYANKLLKTFEINHQMYEVFSPYKMISHFSFYRQLTNIEEMRLIEETDSGQAGMENAINMLVKFSEGPFSPPYIVFVGYLISFIRYNFQKINNNIQISLTFNYNDIIQQIQQIDSYEHYHEHEVFKYVSLLDKIIPQVGIVIKQRKIKLDLRQSYFSQIIKAISRLDCLYCKYNALISYNKTIQLFIPDPQRFDLEQHYLNFIIQLIKDCKESDNSMIFQLVCQGYWFYGLDTANPSRYDYLSLLYEWTSKQPFLIPSIFLIRVFDDMTVQCAMLVFAWKHRFSFEPDAYFNIIIVLCNHLNRNSFFKMIETFLYIFCGYLQIVADYDSFFQENQGVILQYSRSDKQNRYLALYAAILMHPDYLKMAKISPSFFHFIWSKFHQLDTYSKTIINTYIYWASYTHIFKVQNAKQRRINFYSKNELKVAKKNARRISLSFVQQSDKWLKHVVKKMKKKVREQPNNAVKYKANLKKFKLYVSCLL